MASAGQVTWQSGIALLLALVINTIWEIRTAREQPDDSEGAEPDIEANAGSGGWTIALLRVIAGIVILTIGSRVLVSGATSAATLLGVSEAVIGLTIVSAGTSMPELITSLVAALRGRTDLAIGNVVGSCLLNLMLVRGAMAALGEDLTFPELIQEISHHAAGQPCLSAHLLDPWLHHTAGRRASAWATSFTSSTTCCHERRCPAGRMSSAW